MRLREPSTWTCAGCGEEMVGRPPEGERCVACRLSLAEGWRPGQPLEGRVVFEVPLEHRPHLDRAEVLAACGWPPRYRRPFELARLPGGTWPREPRRGLPLAEWDGTPPLHMVLLTGSVGQGKTFLATELAYRRWLAGATIAYVPAGRLVELRWRGRDAWQRRVDVLLVDDLDRGPVGDAWNAVFDTLHHRDAHHLSTVGTSNTPLVKGGGLYRLNAALADRFRGGLVVKMEGKSQR